MKKTKNGRTRKRRAGSVIRICLLLMFGMMFIIGACMFSGTLLEHRNAADAYDELRSDNRPSAAAFSESRPDADGDKQEQKAEETADIAPIRRVSMDISALRENCPDIMAWLYAEGTNIDYPVVQTDNNDYYLTHLYNGESNTSGSLFLDYRNTGLFTEQNTVIYGHHMRNGSMFGSLESYKDQGFYDEYPTMLLYTPEGDYLIELICGTVEDGNYEFVRFGFEDENDLCAYIDSRRGRSTFQSDVEIGPEDRIISLCTCSYERNNARYMLMGKLTPIMENPIR